MKTIWIIFVLILATLTVLPKVEGEIHGRIISGKNAAVGQFPWQILMRKIMNDDEVWCGGSIISENWVLTAAHCTFGLNKLYLTFGVISVADNGISMAATEFNEHPNYNPRNLNNDVSVIKLPQSLTFNNIIKPIKINKNSNSFVGQLCTISGWGYMSDDDLIFSDNLLFAQVNVITKSDCEESYGDNYITDDTICTVGSNNSDESICYGDSGGALIIYENNEAVQIGVNSFVAEEICTQKIPAGYARISSFVPFIEKTTNLKL